MKIETTRQIWPETISLTKPQKTPTPKTVNDRVDVSLPKQVIDAEPEVRMDRIEAVRARMANGYYDRADIREEMATSFLRAQFT